MRTCAIISGRVMIEISLLSVGAQEFAGLVRLGPGRHAFGLVLLVVPDQRLKKLLLGLEVDVERAFGHARNARNVVHAGAVEAVAQEHRAGAVKNLSALGPVMNGRDRFEIQGVHFVIHFGTIPPLIASVDPCYARTSWERIPKQARGAALLRSRGQLRLKN